jgi:NTE family protein
MPAATAASPIPSIGIALGGGFARGIVHVGVLKVLEQEEIPVSFVAGTSVGALIGAAYCSGVSPAELEEIAARVRFKDLARWTLSRYGFATNLRMITFLKKILKVHTFEELQVPLAVTATDFGSGEGVVFRTGPLVDAPLHRLSFDDIDRYRIIFIRCRRISYCDRIVVYRIDGHADIRSGRAAMAVSDRVSE